MIGSRLFWSSPMAFLLPILSQDIDPVQFREAFLRWIEAIQEVVRGVVAIDGKTLSYGERLVPGEQNGVGTDKNRGKVE
jgi:hypothetical protein